MGRGRRVKWKVELGDIEGVLECSVGGNRGEEPRKERRENQHCNFALGHMKSQGESPQSMAKVFECSSEFN